jgi:hypothetical protein
MLKLSFQVRYLDGRQVEVFSRPATEVAFERRFQRSVGSLFSGIVGDAEDGREAKVKSYLNTLQSDYLYFLAWHSARSEQPYDEWLELTEDIGWGFVRSPDPTPPAEPVGP